MPHIRSCSAAAVVVMFTQAVIAQELSPGELVIGSRNYGAVVGPVLPSGLMRHISGKDMSDPGLALRGTGTQFDGPHLALAFLTPDLLIAAASAKPGRFRVDLVTGNRTLLPGTNGPLWTGGGGMLALDSDSFLAIADDFLAGNVGDGKLIKYRLSTGESTLISGIARGDGVVMYRPRSITRLDENSVAIMEFGQLGTELPGAILFRVDLLTGDRTVISTLSVSAPSRYTAVGGVRSANRSNIPLRGAGPAFTYQHRGVCLVGGRLFVGGTADDSFVGGIVEVNLSTGDRTLLGGTAYENSTKVTREFGAGSDAYVPDAPTALTKFGESSFVFTETFGPNKVWKFDIDTRRVRAVADMNTHILPQFQGSALLTGLSVVPCGEGPGFEIVQQPSSTSSCGGAAEFSVSLSTAGPFGYQWSKDGTPIDVTLNPTAASATLLVPGATPSDAGQYSCVVTGACGSRTTEAASLEVCLADFDCSGFVDTDDFTTFVFAFEAGTDNADIDGTGFVDTDDFTVFVLAFEAGC